MNYLLLILSVGLAQLNTGIQNRFSKKMLKNLADCLAFTLLVSLMAAALLIALDGGFPLPSVYTLLLGMLFGAITAMSLISNSLALSAGPMSITVLIGSCAMLVPTICGTIFWREAVQVPQIIGMVLLVTALYLCVNPKKDKSITLRWIALCSLAFISSGLIGVLQKVHQTSPHRGELTAFLVVSFLTAALIMAGGLLVLRCFRHVKRTVPLRSSFPLIALVAGACVGGVNKINMFLAGAMPSILFFPLVNGSNILLSAVIASLLFREKLSRRQIVGFLIGVLAIALVGNAASLLLG